jgi:ADP-heptose:LPS heptosyltransferase
MLGNKISLTFFDFTSKLTTWFPRGGAWLFDHTLIPAVGNLIVGKLTKRHNFGVLKSVKSFKKILVVSDIHIGDTILSGGGIAVFRDYFPDARIDYVVKKSVKCLYDGNPDITNLYPVFTGSQFPNESDLAAVKKLAFENDYDLCLNCCPFISDHKIFPPGQKVLNMVTAAPKILSNLTDKTGSCHFMYQTYDLPGEYLPKITGRNSPRPFHGFPVTLSDEAHGHALNFLKENKISLDQRIYFLNPDTASVFNRIPFDSQFILLKGLLALPGHVLLGSGFTAKDIEKQLLQKLTDGEKLKLSVVPKTLDLDAYAALLDFADIFISGDTGPLHIGAARKISKTGNVKFRNKTFVISVFGATNARMSGYDSTDPLFPPADQDCHSRCYVSESRCRNITCMNKMAKTCKTVRCFEFLDTEKILADISAHLKSL